MFQLRQEKIYMIPNQIILLGGGASCRYLGAIDRGLFSFLQDKFCIGINYSYKWVNTTCNLGVDETLYARNGDHEEIAKLPLWIGKEHWNLGKRELNSIFLKESLEYNRDLIQGVYKPTLSGIFALSLAIKLLDYAEGLTEIYLLGYDNGPAKDENYNFINDSKGRPITHWYQNEFEHRGTGKIAWYTATTLDYESRKRITKAEEEYRVFKNESKVKIYNVGGTSMIPIFPQISYHEFFKNASYTKIPNQDELREKLWSIITTIKQMQSTK